MGWIPCVRGDRDSPSTGTFSSSLLGVTELRDPVGDVCPPNVVCPAVLVSRVSFPSVRPFPGREFEGIDRGREKKKRRGRRFGLCKKEERKRVAREWRRTIVNVFMPIPSPPFSECEVRGGPPVQRPPGWQSTLISVQIHFSLVLLHHNGKKLQHIGKKRRREPRLSSRKFTACFPCPTEMCTGKRLGPDSTSIVYRRDWLINSTSVSACVLCMLFMRCSSAWNSYTIVIFFFFFLFFLWHTNRDSSL